MNAVEDGSVYMVTLVVPKIEVKELHRSNALQTTRFITPTKRQLSPLSMRPSLRKASLRSLTSLTAHLVK